MGENGSRKSRNALNLLAYSHVTAMGDSHVTSLGCFFGWRDWNCGKLGSWPKTGMIRYLFAKVLATAC